MLPTESRRSCQLEYPCDWLRNEPQQYHCGSHRAAVSDCLAARAARGQHCPGGRAHGARDRRERRWRDRAGECGGHRGGGYASRARSSRRCRGCRTCSRTGRPGSCNVAATSGTASSRRQRLPDSRRSGRHQIRETRSLAATGCGGRQTLCGSLVPPLFDGCAWRGETLPNRSGVSHYSTPTPPPRDGCLESAWARLARLLSTAS